MKAKEYLLQIKKIDRMIENKQIEIEQWRSIAESITANSDSERVQSSGNKQKMEDAVCKIVEIENDLKYFKEYLIDLRVDIIRNIEQLDTTEYDILHKAYIQDKGFDEIADSYDKSYSWVTTIHGRALKNLQNVIDNNYSRKEGV